MKFLAINTAGNNVTIALYINGEMFSFCESNEKRASEVLLTQVEKVLISGNVSLSELDFFGVTIGPGSFTGIRIGITTIKAFCFALNKKVFPVTTLNAMSYNGKTDGTAMVVIDASSDMAYYQMFNSDNEAISDAECVENAQLIQVIKQNSPKTVIADETIFKNLSLEANAEMFSGGKTELTLFSENNFANSLALSVENGFKKRGESALVDYNSLTPLYIRRCQAENDRNKKLAEDKNAGN